MQSSTECFDSGLTPLDLADGRARPLRTPWGELALYPCVDGVRAASAWCPHLLGPLIEGTRRGDVVSCPWHMWVFSLTDGRCLSSPRDEGACARLAIHAVSLGPTGTYCIHPPAEPLV